ncbi:DNA polymerase-3 subunit alpha [Arcanobacterium pluranimalium]|uniref:DNA polymerase III subunit alpha n=1 Tax=Arcanobacterium pluranimalium TaxID=108028 RepID=UPI0019583863|nr:DNA polymerase III subunit alpha [Arcanobacterium pluranimalium]MBM7825583.1 DNA polymerase-3 subunit alpha [Arcanobacterium pluranimalium]
MAQQDFAHLHVHTDYSMLDGAAKISKLVNEVVAQEQSAVAITDHGYLFGAFEFWKAAKQAGVKPIIGIEAYMTPGTSRFDTTRVKWGTPAQSADDVSARGAYTHMTLLSENNTGMHNLFRMGSLASLEGQMGKWPRMDRDLLETYHEGLIGTAGCPSGEVQTRLRLGQYDEALRAAGELQDIFGKENFFVEVMDHGIEIERKVQKELIALAHQIGAPIIATNDSHYVKKSDAKIQDAMLCINSGSTLMDPDRFRFDGEGYYLRSTQEMQQLFADIPQACSNTLLIAERCNVNFETTADGANYMPKFPVPPGEDETSWFIREVENGLHERFGETIPDHVRQRANYEVEVIVNMGFPGYFLVVSDYIKWARNEGIRVGPGRGSGAGSMVAYALGITQLDPIRHDLLFERFLNPERVSMPDLDIDFDDRRRGEVIEYVEKKYGKDKVSQVVTFGTIKSKQALKDSARVLGYPFEMGDRLTKAMPPSVMGKDIPVNQIYNKEHPRFAEASEFRAVVDNDPDAKKVFDLALGLEGLVRQTGMHACAVIMSSAPLTDVIPIMKNAKDGAILTQFEYPQCEELGLIKMDFLGLSNLTMINDALRNAAENDKNPPNIDEIELDDKKTYELLARAETLGIFQLDGGGMRSLLKQMKMDNFADISAVSALYRPGPMGANSHINYALRKNGLQNKTPIHPELEESLEEILGQTHGLIVYQEQVMRIAQKLAGFTLGQADILRKAMGKKKAEVLQQQFEGFSAGMRANGYSQQSIDTLWEILVPFSSYAFNKSHSEAYALVSYQTAFLKAHFPAEFMAALLTSNTGKKDKVATYLAECRRMGIAVLVPDVNESRADYWAVGEEIRVGLSAVRNVGSNVVDGIISAREEKGAFTSFQDFLDKVPLQVCNKRALECLIKAGAFDSMGYTRRSLLGIIEEAVDSVVSVKRNEAAGQFDLFGDLGADNSSGFEVSVPDIPEWDKKQKLNFERDMLGLYVSDHPLSGLEPFLNRNSDTTVVELLDNESLSDGASVVVAGIISSVQTRISKKNGKAWATAIVEDLTGSVEVNFFPATYQTVSSMLLQDSVVSVTARVSIRDGAISLNAREMSMPPTDIDADLPIDIHIAERMCTSELMERFKQLLAQYPGTAPVRMHIKQAKKTTIVQLDARYSVSASPSLYGDLKVLLGRDCIMGH